MKTKRTLPPITVMKPPGKWGNTSLRDLRGCRDLILFLTWRDVKVRYTQAAIGMAWAVIQPTMMMVVFSLFLGRVVKSPVPGVPYPVFVFSGLVPWMFFANGVTSSTLSLVSDANLVTKIYFPRLVVPLASALAWLPDLGISTILVAVMMLVFGVVPASTIFFVPLVLGLDMLAVASVGIGLSALNVRYRDVRYAMPYLVQLWFFATPVVYPTNLVPERYRLILGINPLAGVVEGFRWTLFGRTEAPWALMGVSALAAISFLVAGLLYFGKVEHSFADVI